MDKELPDLGKRTEPGEVEVINRYEINHENPRNSKSGRSYDSDKEAYKNENPLPSDEKEYMNFLKE